jgi:hypothetical protein
MRGKRVAASRRIISNAIDPGIDAKFPPCFGGIGQGNEPVSPPPPHASIKNIYYQ